MYQAPRGILRTTMTELNEPTSSVPQFLDRDWSLVQYYSSICLLYTSDAADE